MRVSHFFLSAPGVRLTVEHVRCFERVLDAALSVEGAAVYDCPYPKFDFLFYLAQRKRYLLHGSPQGHITRFEPKRRTAALDPAVAVYATDHEIAALFAAVRPDPRLTLSGYFWARDDHGAPVPFYDLLFGRVARRPSGRTAPYMRCPAPPLTRGVQFGPAEGR